MDESTCFGVLLCGDITSDAVLRLSLDEISRRLETRLRGNRSISRFRTTLSVNPHSAGGRCLKPGFNPFWSTLIKNRNDSKDGGYNDFGDMNAVI